MPSVNKTPNLELNQWLGNEYVKRTDFNEDNKKIDEAYEKLKKEIESKATDAAGTSYDNTNSKLTSTNVQGAIDELNTKTNENKTSILEHKGLIDDLKLSVSNGKNLIATAIAGKGISASGNDTFGLLAGKIDAITVESLGGKKWASGIAPLVKENEYLRYIKVAGLGFKPSTVVGICYNASFYAVGTYVNHKGNNVCFASNAMARGDGGDTTLARVYSGCTENTQYYTKFGEFKISLGGNNASFISGQDVVWYAFE